MKYKYNIVYYNTLDELKDSISFLHEKGYIWCTGKKDEPISLKMCPGMLIVNPGGEKSWLKGKTFCWCPVNKSKISLNIRETNNEKIKSYLQKQYSYNFSRYRFIVIDLSLNNIIKQIFNELT
jgi:hypothetical protein